MTRTARGWLTADPRHGQIATLGLLLTYGVWRLGFDLPVAQGGVTLASVLAVQAFFDVRSGRPVLNGAKSALISGLSLCLLLRTSSLAFAALASTLAVSSKFLVRIRGKHVFNPTNIAIVALMLATDRVWASPGQWGTEPALAFFLASAGLLVVTRATRADVTSAFMASYSALVIARSFYLGEPLTIPFHRLESGAFLLFSFFMISDPKTTPDSRIARVTFAALVALGAAYVQFRLFRTNGPLWSLAVCSPLVPILDRMLPARRYQWPRPVTREPVHSCTPAPAPLHPCTPAPLHPCTRAPVHPCTRAPVHHFGGLPMTQHRLSPGRTSFTRSLLVVAATLTSLAAAARAEAFCGFYVARADTKLFNKASQVVLVRDGDKTVITMASDFKGDPKEFAMVVPVPTSITREQIHITEQKLVDHLDGFTAPRLVEYFDEDPCAIARRDAMRAPMAMALPMMAQDSASVGRAKSLGVTIEASYTVGEYDILILSAQQSGGLETWLRESGYRIPAGASDVLATYIKQNMRFFVARVNLKEQSALGFAHLRPIQVAYESPKFMLPLRLGMVNADGAQELFVYTLTRKGRVEATNYRTVKLRTDVEIPTYVKDPDVFARMYRALFERQVQQEQMSAVFQEYAWDMAWCDPCAADPLTAAELRELGVFWDDSATAGSGQFPFPIRRGPSMNGPQNVFVTRLHVRYDKVHFPEDLVFQETGDRTNFQGRYVLRHAWTGESKCREAERYEVELRQRQEREAQTLASLTGWRLEDIRTRIPVRPPYRPQPASSIKPPVLPTPPDPPAPWWMRIWR